MAVWQYDVRLIPEQSVLKNFGRIPEELQAKLIEEGDWWRDILPPCDDELLALAPVGKSWTKAIRAWGSDDSDRIECHFEDGELWDIRFRIDVRKLSKPFILGLLDLGRRHNLLLNTESGRLLRPTLEFLLADMQRSNAIAFACKPEEFLNNLDVQND